MSESLIPIVYNSFLVIVGIIFTLHFIRKAWLITKDVDKKKEALKADEKKNQELLELIETLRVEEFEANNEYVSEHLKSKKVFKYD